jgi:hypothetical protein
MAAGVGQVGGVGVEVLVAGAAIVLRAEQDDIAGPAGVGVAQVVEGAAGDPIPVGAVPAPRAGAAARVAAPDADLGLGQILDAIDTDGGVGAIFAGSGHGVTPERRGLPGDTFDDGRAFTAPPGFLAIDCKKRSNQPQTSRLMPFFRRGTLKLIRSPSQSCLRRR